jgi:hypothetical protein
MAKTKKIAKKLKTKKEIDPWDLVGKRVRVKDRDDTYLITSYEQGLHHINYKRKIRQKDIEKLFDIL